jgi:UDP:flavonoid glycosyltransferase YjiC (YdhE family)
MNYPIPTTLKDMVELLEQPVNEELVATAIAGVVKIARDRGQSLSELTAEVLKDDLILDRTQRDWLSRIVALAWESLPHPH